MPRKKRTKVDEFRAKVFIHFVCDLLKVPLVPSELSLFFEGSRSYRCKWGRYLSGRHTPSEKTLAIILEKVQLYDCSPHLKAEVKELYYSNLWEVLEANNLSKEAWNKLFDKFPHFIKLEFAKNTFTFSDNRRYDYLNQTSINKLGNSCNLEAFACLIAHAKRKIQIYKFASVNMFIQQNIRKLLLAYMYSPGWRVIRKEFWKYIKTSIFGNLYELNKIAPIIFNYWDYEVIKYVHDQCYYGKLVKLLNPLLKFSSSLDIRVFLMKVQSSPSNFEIELITMFINYPELKQEQVKLFNNLARSLNRYRVEGYKISLMQQSNSF